MLLTNLIARLKQIQDTLGIDENIEVEIVIENSHIKHRGSLDSFIIDFGVAKHGGSECKKTLFLSGKRIGQVNSNLQDVKDWRYK